MLCILSHGESGVVFGTDGRPVKIEDLETLFDGQQCNQLVGRPKLFLIQACQGGLLCSRLFKYFYFCRMLSDFATLFHLSIVVI